MNQERVQAYLELIQALLECENGQEDGLLQTNSELVDASLVAIMEQYADYLGQQGQENAARWLRSFAERLGQFLAPQSNAMNDYGSFLQTLLETVAESNGSLESIHPLLQNNLTLLDENFVNLLQTWGNQAGERANTPEERYQLGAFLYRLAYAFHEFPGGNPLINLAIAVYGYEFCAATERQTGLERDLSSTLNNLGEVR